MALPSTALDQYVQAMREFQARVVDGQRDRLLEVARRMAETTRRDQRIFLFGTGPLDNGGVPGDALLPLEGFPWRVAPSSTVICALLWNGLVAETARLLLESGMEPPVFVSLNVAGAAQHNQALLDKWRPRNMHL